MAESMSEFVTLEVEEQVAVVTIDRPAARNAINADVAAGIEAAIDRIEDSAGIWVGVLTAKPPVFCAGADLKEVGAGNAKALATKRGGFAGFVRRERWKPVIAAVEGAALAGGAEMVLACDLVVATASARFGLPEVSRGLIAEAGGLFRLGRKIPLNVAMQVALTGGTIPALTAERFGLVNVLCEDGGARDAAVDLARQICRNAPLAVRESRKVVLAATYAADEEGWSRSSAAFARVAGSQDVQEGVAAFIEKREPRWQGK
jgi:enoyl-CoA hydratase